MGWAEGLQSGLALGNAFRQGQIRNDLSEEAKKHQVTEYNPEQGKVDDVIAQRDTAAQGLIAQGMDSNQAYQQATQQYLPQINETASTVGLVKPQYSYGGQTYTDRKAADLAAEQGLTSGMANVYAQHGDIEKASELKSRAQQQQLTAFQLGKAGREAEAETRLSDFNNELNTLEAPTAADVKTLAAKHKLDRGQQFAVASQITGIAKNELEAHDIEIKQATKGKSFEQLLDLHKNDKRFNDGYHFVSAKGRGGEVVLHLVKDDAPDKVIRSQSFKDADMATAYMRKEAEDPGNVAEWVLGMRTKEAQINASNASAAAHTAEAGLAPLKGKLYQAQAAAWAAKPETAATAAATAAENRQFSDLTKTQAWQSAERKKDTNMMNELMIGRGLDPAKHGGQGAGDWNVKPTAAPAKTEGLKTAPAVETKKPAAEAKPTVTKPAYTYQQQQAEAKAAREKGLQDRAARQQQEALAAQKADEDAAKRRAALAADFNSKYGR